MPYNKYPYEAIPLKFPYNALEPYIDEETMHLHHDKHYQTYINKLNAALEPYPYLQQLTIDQLLSNPAVIPYEARLNIMHNAGGVYNHALFFNNLAPAGQGAHLPYDGLLDEINRDFGSFDEFKKQFNDSARGVFGSGWTYLARLPGGKLTIFNTKNQDTPLRFGLEPILLLDEWEHAYYLKYKNERDKYIDNMWNVLTFNE